MQMRREIKFRCLIVIGKLRKNSFAMQNKVSVVRIPMYLIPNACLAVGPIGWLQSFKMPKKFQ